MSKLNVLTIFNEQVRIHLIEFIIVLRHYSLRHKQHWPWNHEQDASKGICPINSKILSIIQILYELNLFTLNRKWVGYYRVWRLSVWVRRLWKLVSFGKHLSSGWESHKNPQYYFCLVQASLALWHLRTFASPNCDVGYRQTLSMNKDRVTNYLMVLSNNDN